MIPISLSSPTDARISVERGTLNVLDAASTDISPRLTVVRRGEMLTFDGEKCGEILTFVHYV